MSKIEVPPGKKGWVPKWARLKGGGGENRPKKKKKKARKKRGEKFRLQRGISVGPL